MGQMGLHLYLEDEERVVVGRTSHPTLQCTAFPCVLCPYKFNRQLYTCIHVKEIHLASPCKVYVQHLLLVARGTALSSRYSSEHVEGILGCHARVSLHACLVGSLNRMWSTIEVLILKRPCVLAAGGAQAWALSRHQFRPPVFAARLHPICRPVSRICRQERYSHCYSASRTVIAESR